jgi:AcrR family transcriptional regulator
MVQVKPALSRRPANRPRNAAATRAALTDAAAEIFRVQGYFQTDSNAIARRAGYAPASFYKHFADKPAILLAVYETYAAQEWAGISAAARNAAAADRIACVLAFLERFHATWARFRTDLRTVARMEPPVAKTLAAARTRQMAALAGIAELDPLRDGARLLAALALAERYAEILAEAETLKLDAASVRAAVAAALSGLLVRGP